MYFYALSYVWCKHNPLMVFGASHSLGCKDRGPFSITNKWPPWQWVSAAATINTLGMRY